ncbi:solute carrier family 15 member 4-like [Lytechinus variegatus]|uniref:solute carrier family 15 member 4-like n=1 Tax=Lytechinus variegatus TaxID=7654 RepID=UPI001BB2CBDB|nr:solute carrier family 15 member 4-like [Lytechinus variegatus]
MPSSEREPLFSSSSTSMARGSTSMKYDAALELAPSRSQSVVDEPPPESMKQRMRRSVWFPISFVFGFVFFITLVEHGVRFNVVLYTEKVLEYTKGHSPILIAAFDAIAPCLPLLGGWLGDSWFTRSKVTLTGAFATLLGILLLTITVAPYSPEAEENFSISAKRALFVLGFTLLFVGLALYGANDYVIAAREIERDRGLNNNGIRNMFCVFYIVYFTAISCSELVFRLVDATSFFFVYLLLDASVVLSITSMVLGQKFYVKEQRKRFVLRNQIRIIWEGIRRRKHAPNVPKWIQRASTQYGGSFKPEEVYETSHLLRTIPIFHTVTIFVIVNYFIDLTYHEQTLLLNPVFDDTTTSEFIYNLYQPIVSVLTNLTTLLILYPCTSRWGRCDSPFIRIGVGILFGILSVTFAAIVETRRKQMTVGDEEEEDIMVTMVTNITYNASSLSVMSQIPQYTCAGIADALVLTAGVEVSYVEAPYSLKGVAVGLFLLMSGVGSYILAQLIILIVNGISGAAGEEWYTENLNTSSMEYFYCILAAILILDILYIYLVTRKYERADWESVKTKVTMDDKNDDDENVDTIFDDFDGENRECQEEHTLEMSDTSSLSER